MDPARHPGTGSGPALKRPWRDRLRRWLRPPRQLRPTRAGWCFFALVLGVGFGALNTGNNLLYLVLSLMLAFLVLSGVFSESALRGIKISRRPPREIFAHTDNTVALRITNTQRRVPAFAIVVEDLFRDAKGTPTPCGRCFTLRVGARETDVRSYLLRPERRGTLRFSGFRVSTRFPFGLFSKSLAIEESEEVLVFPAVEPVTIPEDFGSARDSGDALFGAHGSGTVATGLREYEPGDSLRRIQWRASARRRTLLVRELESEQAAEVEVRLRTIGQEPGKRFEKGVSWAASEALALLEGGSRVALRTDREFIPPDSGARHRARLLTYLARVEPLGGPATNAASDSA